MDPNDPVIQNLLAQISSLQNDVGTVKTENFALREAALERKTMADNMQLLVESLKESSKTSMIDTKGIGRPKVFDNVEAHFSVWSKKLVDFIEAVFPGADRVMD